MSLLKLNLVCYYYLLKHFSICFLYLRNIFSLGTGKTATFAISALQIIDRNFLQCQSIILAPTRDLAQQIHEVVSAIGINMGLKILACVGGTTENLDLKALREGVHIVIGMTKFKCINNLFKR